jgi:hypothetical protein
VYDSLKVSAKELGKMTSFVGAIHASQHTVALEKLLKGHSVADNIVKHQIHNKNVDGYPYIPSLCAGIIKYNPGSQICCQVDSENHFYQFCMILPSCISALDACIPCLEIDAKFMKHPTYNGVCIMVISKTVDHKNMGLVPSKNN